MKEFNVKYFIVNKQKKPLSGFYANDMVGRQLVFRKRDCMSFDTKISANEMLAYIQENCSQRRSASALVVSDYANW